MITEDTIEIRFLCVIKTPLDWPEKSNTCNNRGEVSMNRSFHVKNIWLILLAKLFVNIVIVCYLY